MRLLSHASFRLALLALTSTAFAVGCAQTAEDIEESTDDLKGISVPNPSGTYFANISATGTGCPAGSYTADISDDGQTFTVLFSQYEASINPGQAVAVKDCTLSIDIKSPQGLSFAVSSFYYQGYAALTAPGVTAKQTAKYYFRGNPVPAQELRTDLSGPFNDSYLFSDTIVTQNLVWSACGATSNLNAQTRLVLDNNPSNTGGGYVNTSSVDGDMVFEFGLSWKKCGSNNTVPIHRSYNQGNHDHLQTLTANEGAPGWGYEGVSLRLYADDSENRSAMYRCLIRGTALHFMSGDAGCEGQNQEGRLGYVSTVGGAGLSPLYRCSLNGDHLSTLNPGECAAAGMANEGQQGFAFGPDANDQVTIYRSFNGSNADHMLTRTVSEQSPAWGYEGPAFHLYQEAAPGRGALYRCRIDSAPAPGGVIRGQGFGGPIAPPALPAPGTPPSRHFISGDANCEGLVQEGLLGFTSATPTGFMLYRCVNPSNGDHLTTSLGECQGAGFQVEGPQGYAL